MLARTIHISVLGLLLGMLSSLCLAASDIWTVAESSGTVRVTQLSGPVHAQVGAHLSAPFTVETGVDGHLVIGRDEDKMTVGANVRFDVQPPAREDRGMVTRVIQTLGSLLYHVQRRPDSGFEVQTPYLVSVVKGTTFNVLVGEDSTTVALIEGRLQLVTPDHQSELFLETGQAAVKSRLSDRILMKDQHVLSLPARGPITIVHEDAHRTVVDVAAAGFGSATLGTSGQGSGKNSVGPGINLGSSLDLDGLSTSTVTGISTDTPALNLGGTTLNIGSTSIGTAVPTGVSAPSLDIGASLTVGGTTVSTNTDLGGLTSSVSTGAIEPAVGTTTTAISDTTTTLNATISTTTSTVTSAVNKLLK